MKADLPPVCVRVNVLIFSTYLNLDFLPVSIWVSSEESGWTVPLGLWMENGLNKAKKNLMNH